VREDVRVAAPGGAAVRPLAGAAGAGGAPGGRGAAREGHGAARREAVAAGDAEAVDGDEEGSLAGRLHGGSHQAFG
jgi:hypothetical protein